MIMSKLFSPLSKPLFFSTIPRISLRREFRFRAFVRRFCEKKNETERSYAEAQKQSLREKAMGPPGPNAYAMGKGAMAGGAIIGLLALCYYGIGMGQEKGNVMNKSKLWPKYVHDRIRSTYAYLGGSVMISALSSFLVFNTPPLLFLVTRTGILSVLATTAAIIASGYVAQTLPYEEGLGLKQLAWMGHCVIMGAAIAPICFLGGPVMIRAAMYTGGIVGGLSAVAVCAPSDKFLYMGGPLAIGLGLLIAASLASLWLPPTTAIGAGISSFTLYGGLLIFSGFLLYDTQRIIYTAENHPIVSNHKFDPISAAISVYMDILNIFIRMAVILSGDQGKRR